MAPEISFSTLGAIMRVDATLAHGMTPSLIRLDFPEQEAPIDRGGDLRFKFNGEQVVLKDCLIDQSSLQAGTAGKIKTIAVFDRRWRWEFQDTSFSFNERNEANEIRVSPEPFDLLFEGYSGSETVLLQKFYNTKRSARQIGDFLLKAMGENAVANNLPDEKEDAFPEFAYDNIRPAMALAILCSLYQCSIVLQIDNKIAIRRLGKGKELLHNLPILSETKNVDLNSRPEKVRVITAPVLYQWDFRLRAVGEETDGNFLPIDELSYVPEGGWDTYADILMGYFNLDGDPDQTDKVTRIATRSVWRAFRPTYRGGGTAGIDSPMVIDGHNVVVYDQIRSFKNKLTTTVFEQGAKRPQKPLVYGQNYGWSSLRKSVTDEDFEVPQDLDSTSIVKVGWLLDPENGLVWFSGPMVNISTATFTPADLFLRVAFNLRDENDRVRIRKHFDANVKPPFNAGLILTQVVESLEPTNRYDFKKIDKNVGADGAIIAQTPIDNFGKLRKQAQPYLDALLRKVEDESGPEDITYSGLVKSMELDGAIRSITWVVSRQGVVTRIQRNQDLGSSTTLSGTELRHLERTSQTKLENDRLPSMRLRAKEANA